MVCSSDMASGRYKSKKGDTIMSKSLKALTQKKTLFALVLALTIFGAVYGFAATLNVGTNQLSAGNATVASCEAGTATGTYTVAYDTSIAGYKVTNVTVTGIDAACGSKTVSVTLTGAAGANLATISGTSAVGGGTLALAVPGVIDAKLVTGVAVAIAG
jgi:hypothetical protein